MRRLLQIDLLKALAIVGVIVNHWMIPEQRSASYAALHVSQAVPVFFLLMAFNAKQSLDRASAGASLAQIYRSGYLGRRLSRLLVPLVVVVPVGTAWAWLHGAGLYIGAQSLLMRAPFPFAGQFFVPISIVFVAAAPVLYVAYRRAPRSTVAACIALSVAFELVAPLKVPGPLYYVYQVNPLRFITLFGLGFWLADDADPLSRRNRFVIPFAIGSAGLLIACIHGLRANFFGVEYMYNVLAFGWPLLLTSAGLKLLPQTSTRTTVLAVGELGRASYHVFLVQGLWFGGINPGLVSGDPLWLTLSLLVCCGCGLLWYYAERAVRRALHSADVGETGGGIGESKRSIVGS